MVVRVDVARARLKKLREMLSELKKYTRVEAKPMVNF
jgi:hypothetical protein